MELSDGNINNLGGAIKARLASIESGKFEETPSKIRLGKTEISNNFSVIYHGLSERYNLSPTESILLAMIYSLSGQGKKVCYMGVGTFAKRINVSEPTINTSLNNLKEKGLIENGSKDLRFGTVRRRPTSKAIIEIEELKRLRGRSKKY